MTASERAAYWKDHDYLSRDSASDTGFANQPILRRRIDANTEKWPAQRIPRLARALSYWLWRDDCLMPDDRVLIDVFEHSIWSSSEDWNLYYAWRLARAGNRSLLDDAPAHLFLQYERADCASLLFLGLTAGWGLSCASPQCSRAFHVDHDGHGLLVAWSESELDAGARIYGHTAPPWGLPPNQA